MREIRVAIADDETVARQLLRELVSRDPGLRFVGEATTAPEAVEIVARTRPELLFLDIKMPGGSGLDALRIIRNGEERPWVVFTTAYDEFALDAFELRAIDFLLKPFDHARFEEAVRRARLLIEGEVRLRRLGPSVYTSQGLDRLFVRESGRILPVPLTAIRYFEASSDCVMLHLEERSYVTFVPLKELERRLDERFVRVRRSHLVNLDHVEAFERHDRRRLAVVLTDGTTIVASRRSSRTLRELAR